MYVHVYKISKEKWGRDSGRIDRRTEPSQILAKFVGKCVNGTYMHLDTVVAGKTFEFLR